MNNKSKAEKQKLRIIRTAAELFRRKSFLGTTINDVASRLKINSAMIHYYFKSKSLLLYEVISYAADNLLKELRFIIDTDDSPVQKLRAIVINHVKAYGNRENMLGVAQFELKNLPSNLAKSYIAKRDLYEQIFRDVLQEGMAMGHFMKSDPTMTSRFILGLLNSVSTWFKPRGPLTAEEIGEEAWKFIARSIQVDPASGPQRQDLGRADDTKGPERVK